MSLVWTLDIGHWTLNTGHWTLDTGHWTLDTGRPVVSDGFLFSQNSWIIQVIFCMNIIRCLNCYLLNPIVPSITLSLHVVWFVGKTSQFFHSNSLQLSAAFPSDPKLKMLNSGIFRCVTETILDSYIMFLMVQGGSRCSGCLNLSKHV